MNDTRTQLRHKLQRVEKENYQLREGESREELIAQMLRFIGDPDPELRDGLIYPTFYVWMTEERLTEEEWRCLLQQLADENHLFHHIGSDGDQTVFTRTFSVLPLALIARRHSRKPFLDRAGYELLKHSLLRYYREEKDLRGLLPEEGWAHSAAHGADALKELVQCPESDAAVQRDVLAAIQGMLQNGSHIFGEEEDERIASILDAMIGNGRLSQAELADWITGLSTCLDWPRSRAQAVARVNGKNLLRSLYFRRGQEGGGNALAAAILEAEAGLNRFAVADRQRQTS
ncbi:MULTISPECIES: DUF2785 domain-containing protein [unclassified Paenibacillus]|uniref:DUF2785 domain-containing protein n=1 Tax=unclassified Paenibacillus TaxID=185978 RepID=UPI0009571449|nr:MULTISPECIES: DUF2785 domain-containing protein [unclassified Paenibacillus]ASS64940.1 DUF2785 domain-containing protein [Paenibacillus sp. RUD330]SIR00658.1 Protein of unknown function [Paenibacillus sp. RU4X]SIR34261.1 Protein of unknown function [Paenibacillus sp. RU4T]